MKEIRHGGLLFSVDIEATKKYYEESSLCDCVYCKYYSSKIGGLFPKLEEFLRSFAIDISKPDETFPIELDSALLFDSVGYTVCGRIEHGEGEEAEIDGFKLNFRNGFGFPNEQKGEYFSIEVKGVKIDRD